MLRNKANSNFIAIWLFPIFILGLSFLIELGGDELRESLRYQNDSFTNNEFWRWATGHLTHLGWSHFFLNAAGMLLVWSLFGRVYSGLRWLLIFIICTIGSSCCFYVLDENLEWYVGLSGVLHGLILAGLLQNLFNEFNERKVVNKADIILLLIVIFKLMYEQFIGAVPMTEASSGGHVVVNAHLYGAIIGTICALFFIIKDKSLSP